MRYLIVLEPTEAGFSVQVPDLAIVTHGDDVASVKRAAVRAIQINLDAYRAAGQDVPKRMPVLTHLENPDFEGLLFTYIDVDISKEKLAA